MALQPVFSSMKQHWRNYLWLFPTVAGTSWLVTLTTLLIWWLAAGRPRMPLQSNPYVAFISDIGAFHLKPLFITGCSITAITFVGTVFAVHYARHSKHLYGFEDPKWKKVVSVLALAFGLVACAALLLLTIFDTYRFHEIHGYMLFLCFGGLSLTMLLTTVVWFDQAWKPSQFVRLRRWCVIGNAIVLADLILVVGFIGAEWQGYLRVAGILEWVLTFLGGFYLLTFAGYLRAPETMVPAKTDDERQPLLDER